MYQGGIKNIKLYENKGIDFYYYDPIDLKQITNLTNLGDVIEIENFQRPDFEVNQSIGKGGALLSELIVKFRILGLNSETENTIDILKSSIYGFCPLVEFYDGAIKFWNAPLFCRESNIKPQSEMSFEVSLKTSEPTKEKYLEYTAGVSTTPVFRADTTLLTADSTIYTADYAL